MKTWSLCIAWNMSGWKASKAVKEMHIIRHKFYVKLVADSLFASRTRCNYAQYVISRPDLYNILWVQIPRANILLGKKILDFQQSRKGVRIECSDKTVYHGDILVGADGAYSAVRQQLYKGLKAANKLPSSDDVGLPFGCICLVGQTTVLNPNEYTALKANICDFNSVLGSENRCTVCVSQCQCRRHR